MHVVPSGQYDRVTPPWKSLSPAPEAAAVGRAHIVTLQAAMRTLDTSESPLPQMEFIKQRRRPFLNPLWHLAFIGVGFKHKDME